MLKPIFFVLLLLNCKDSIEVTGQVTIVCQVVNGITLGATNTLLTVIFDYPQCRSPTIEYLENQNECFYDLAVSKKYFFSNTLYIFGFFQISHANKLYEQCKIGDKKWLWVYQMLIGAVSVFCETGKEYVKRESTVYKLLYVSALPPLATAPALGALLRAIDAPDLTSAFIEEFTENLNCEDLYINVLAMIGTAKGYCVSIYRQNQ